MAIGANFFERFQVASGFVPVDLTGGPTVTDWVSLKDFHSLTILFYGAIGTAGQDPTFTVSQATNVSAAGSKALNFETIYQKIGATSLTAVNLFTKVTQAAANTYVDATTAENEKIIGIYITSDMLDVAGGFDCVSVSIADLAAAQLAACIFILEPRYSPPPTAITD